MAKAKEEVKEEKEPKTKAKKTEPIEEKEIVNTANTITTGTIAAEQVGIDLAEGEDETVETYVRQTPFGIEVWDPETKTTTMKQHG